MPKSILLVIIQLYTLHNKKKLIGLGNKLQELILIPIRRIGINIVESHV
jgi:hypothetical protein